MKSGLVILIFMVIAGLYSCKPTYDLPQGDVPSTYLNVINGSTDTLNYYVNGTRQNNASSMYPGGYTGYQLNIKSGAKNYEFRKMGQPGVLFSKPLTLKDSTAYTLYIGGETADKTFFAEDTLVADTLGPSVRFVHTSAAAPALDISIGGTTVFSNKSFKSISAFKTIAAGTQTINVYEAGKSTVLSTLRINLLTSEVYTIYIKGVPNGKGASAFTVAIFVNR